MPIPYKRCLLILADGARADVMRDLCVRGLLPEIAENLVASGSLKTALSVFPSTTGPAYLPFLTGCYPGTCNVPGIRWFDKNQYARGPFSKKRFRSYVGLESMLMDSDLRPEIPTLFDILKESANVFSSIHRGVGFWGDRTKFSRIWYWYYAHLTDRWGFVDRIAGEKLIRIFSQKEEDIPRFTFAVFPGIDEYSHLASPFHPRTFEAYQTLDRSIGKIIRRLKQSGLWEQTMICIVSDHGLSETKRHFGLNQFLEKSGLQTFYYPKIYKWGFDAASMVSGNGMSHLYFKNQGSWAGRTSWEELQGRKDRLVERLLEEEAVDLMMSQRTDGAIVIKSVRGEAILRAERKQDRPLCFHYEIRGGDPFGYSALPALMTDRESLALTAASDYPDGIMQVFQIFESPRTGDLLLSARKGHDLRIRYEIHEHKSSHGSLHWEHMQIPLVSNVAFPEGPVRSVDVFPAILSRMGETLPRGTISIDGVIEKIL